MGCSSGKPLGPEPPLQKCYVQQVKRYHIGCCCHQAQQSLELFYSEWLAKLHTVHSYENQIIWAGNKHACIIVDTIQHQEKWFSVLEKANSSWRSALTPSLSLSEIDISMPNALIKLISTNCWYNSIHRCPGVAEKPELHPHIWWKHWVTMLGQKEEPEYWNALPLKANLRKFLCCWKMDTWTYVSPMVTNQPSDLVWDSISFIVSILNVNVLTEWFSWQNLESEATLHLSMEQWSARCRTLIPSWGEE